jgi:hypothetical protein
VKAPAALLHNREAGHWTLAPAGAGTAAARRYPAVRRQLGNFPQAFSHLALVISAVQLHSGRPARSDSMSM